MQIYSTLARFYDLENATLTEDIPFWLELAHEFGGPVLELGCGTGRVTLQLAREGFEVTGVDSSPEMLSRAIASLDKTPKISKRVRWVEADFSKLNLEAPFRLILAPFHTLTHLSDNTTLSQTLTTVRDHLAKEGAFAFDLPNPVLVYENVLQGLVLERTFRDEEKGTTIQQFSALRVDRLAQTGHITWIYDEIDSQGTVSRITVPMILRYLFPQQLSLLLENAGFKDIRFWGDFDRSPLADESPRIVVHCRG